MPKPFNIDKFNEQKMTYVNAIAASIRSQDEDQIKLALENWQNFMSDEIMQSFDEYSKTADKAILAARGVRQLSKEETDFYNKFIEANIKNEGVITNIDKALPETVINEVMEDVKRNHPLLNEIDFINSTAVTKWIFSTEEAQAATWDELNTEITKKLTGSIDSIDLTVKKLTAYMFCTKDMLYLGPNWVDSYIRAVLSEAIATGLEISIVDGNSLKEPTGMTRDLDKPIDQNTGLPRKQAIVVNDFGKETYFGLIDKLAVSPKGNPRAVSEVILLVNPKQLYSKVMPATTTFVDGRYVSNVFPFPTKVISSVGVPENHAVIGIAKKYIMRIGAGTRGGKIEYSDEYKLLEDLRTYVTRLYGNGRAKDNNAFLYLDITNIGDVINTVNVREVKGVVKTKEQE